jgi:sterol desaturase/sphingolipid hydroxylase (fatty acid hydroxylase superfamily)
MDKKFISNKDETVRLFKNDIMEALSRVHFTVPLFIYVPVIFYFLYHSIFSYSLSFASILSLIVLGIVVWTLTEYTLHRFIFHYTPKSGWGEKLHFILHGVHHAYPKDTKRLVMPPSVSVPLAFIFYFLFKSILGVVFVCPFFIGFLTGYLFYDITHYAIHHFPIHNKFFLILKKHHARHHYQDEKSGFGVSSPLWDDIVGTNFSDSKINEE